MELKVLWRRIVKKVTIHGDLLYYALYPNNFKSSPESEMIFSNRNPTFSKSFPEAMLSTEVIATIRFMPSFLYTVFDYRRS